MPADVKASFEALQKDVAALAPKLTAPAGGGRAAAVAVAAADAAERRISVVAQSARPRTG